LTAEKAVIFLTELYFMLGLHEALSRPGPDLVICDEGHRIKNSHASISQALKNIRTKYVRLLLSVCISVCMSLSFSLCHNRMIHWLTLMCYVPSESHWKLAEDKWWFSTVQLFIIPEGSTWIYAHICNHWYSIGLSLWHKFVIYEI